MHITTDRKWSVEWTLDPHYSHPLKIHPTLMAEWSCVYKGLSALLKKVHVYTRKVKTCFKPTPLTYRGYRASFHYKTYIPPSSGRSKISFNHFSGGLDNISKSRLRSSRLRMEYERWNDKEIRCLSEWTLQVLTYTWKCTQQDVCMYVCMSTMMG